MRLIIVRHGKTIENEKRILQGHMPGILSEEGRRQVNLLAKHLKDDKIDAIYTSDLKRAVDTTEAIARYHQDIPIIKTQLLREADMGPYTGKPNDIDWGRRPPEIETPQSMRKRSIKILEKAYDEHKDDTVLFVTHAGTKIQMMAYLEGRPATQEDFKISNTSYSIVEIMSGKDHKIHAKYKDDHLS